MLTTILLTTFASFSYPQQSQENWEFYSYSFAFAYSEPVAVDALINDWNDKLDSGDIAFTHDRFEAGARYKGLRVAKVLRYDYIIKFNNQTAEAVYLDKNDLEIDPQANYSLYLAPQHVRSSGLLLGYSWQILPQLLVDISVTKLDGLQLLDGRVSASIVGADFEEKDLDRANAKINYHYSEPKLSEDGERYFYNQNLNDFEPWDPSEPKGQGWASDIRVHWKINANFELDLLVEDLYHKISWEQTPFTRDNYVFDPEVHILPIFRGKLGLEEFNQSLSSRKHFKLRYNYSDRLGSEIYLYQANQESFPRLSINYQWLWTQWQLTYDFHAKATGISIINKYVKLDVLSDNLNDYKKAHTLSILIGIQIPFL